MQRAFGLDVPDTVAEMCRPGAAAVLVYDAQAGILPHVKDQEALVERIRQVVDAARAAGVPVLYVRHVSLPPTHLGVGGLRTAMAWQRKEQAHDVTSAFPPDAAHTAIVDELGAHLPARLPLLVDVAADLHANPEIRFTEVHAAAVYVSVAATLLCVVLLRSRAAALLLGSRSCRVRWGSPSTTSDSPSGWSCCTCSAPRWP